LLAGAACPRRRIFEGKNLIIIGGQPTSNDQIDPVVPAILSANPMLIEAVPRARIAVLADLNVANLPHLQGLEESGRGQGIELFGCPCRNYQRSHTGNE